MVRPLDVFPRRGAAACCAALLLACQTSPSPPEPTYPDLTGTWTTDVRAIYSGEEGPHAFPVEDQPINVARLHFEVEIEFQDGPLFYGTARSTGEAERLFGAIRSDGREAVYTTSLGRGVFYMRGPDEMESCATRGTPSSLLATCNILRREPRLRLVPER
jgi:hypothetical protein